MTQINYEPIGSEEVGAIMMNVRGDLICYIDRDKTIPTIHHLNNAMKNEERGMSNNAMKNEERGMSNNTEEVDVGVMGDGVLIIKFNKSTHELNKTLTPIIGQFSIKDSRRGFSRFQVKDLIGTIKDIVNANRENKND